MAGLSAKRRKFAHEYVRQNKNGVQAAIAAGYTDNYFAAAVTANRLLKNAKVSEVIEKHMSKAAEKADLTAERVTREIAKVAYSEAKIIGSDKMKALDMAAAILGIKKADQPQESDAATHRNYIAIEVKRLQLKHGDDPVAYDAAMFQLRTQFTDQSDPAYDPLLDYTKHPENWPPLESPAPEATDANN